MSLLPIFGKSFGKTFNGILLQEKLLNPNQSGFCPSNSCIYQLLTIKHEIFELFACNPLLEVRSVFLDISKVFDKVWQEVLLYKRRPTSIWGKLYRLLRNYLSSTLQIVIWNGKTPSWRPVLADVSQGSVLVPLLFLVYINDLPHELKSSAKLLADDTSPFTIVKDNSESANILNNDVLFISEWAYTWKMLFNPDTSKLAQNVLFSSKKKVQIHPTIILNNIVVERALTSQTSMYLTWWKA